MLWKRRAKAIGKTQNMGTPVAHQNELSHDLPMSRRIYLMRLGADVPFTGCEAVDLKQLLRNLRNVAEFSVINLGTCWIR